MNMKYLGQEYFDLKIKKYIWVYAFSQVPLAKYYTLYSNILEVYLSRQFLPFAIWDVGGVCVEGISVVLSCEAHNPAKVYDRSTTRHFECGFIVG